LLMQRILQQKKSRELFVCSDLSQKPLVHVCVTKNKTTDNPFVSKINTFFIIGSK